MKFEALETFTRKSDGTTVTPGDNLDPSPEKAAVLIEKGRVRIVDETPSCFEPDQERDPIVLGERIGLKFENETPDDLGKPAFIYRGHPLAWEKDPAHIKVYAWATVNLFPGRPLAVDPDSTAPLLGLTPREVRDSLARLVKDGDLTRTWERGRELFKMVIRYSGGTE